MWQNHAGLFFRLFPYRHYPLAEPTNIGYPEKKFRIPVFNAALQKQSPFFASYTFHFPRGILQAC